MLFSKKEYKEMFLPFRLDGNAEDISFGGISIEVFTDFFDAPKYCYATYALKNSISERQKRRSEILLCNLRSEKPGNV